MSLLVDKLKANGSGSTNDGNKVFARVTNVDQSLIHNFKIILFLLLYQQVLDLEKFETFCFHTANLYMTKYPWFPMPATIHKVDILGKKPPKQGINFIKEIGNSMQEKIAVLIILKIFLIEQWIPLIQLFLE